MHIRDSHFLFLSSISSYDYTMNYPSVTGHLGVPQFAFMNNAAMNILLFPVEPGSHKTNEQYFWNVWATPPWAPGKLQGISIH